MKGVIIATVAMVVVAVIVSVSVYFGMKATRDTYKVCNFRNTCSAFLKKVHDRHESWSKLWKKLHTSSTTLVFAYVQQGAFPRVF